MSRARTWAREATCHRNAFSPFSCGFVIICRSQNLVYICELESLCHSLYLFISLALPLSQCLLLSFFPFLSLSLSSSIIFSTSLRGKDFHVCGWEDRGLGSYHKFWHLSASRNQFSEKRETGRGRESARACVCTCCSCARDEMTEKGESERERAMRWKRWDERDEWDEMRWDEMRWDKIRSDKIRLPAPMNHVKIFKGWPLPPSEMPLRSWYNSEMPLRSWYNICI